MIKALIFDWHGVLDDIRYEELVRLVSSSSGKSIEEIEKYIKQYERAYVIGELDPESFWESIKHALQLSDEVTKKARDYVITIKKNQSLWEILQTLKHKYTLAILSDCPLDKAQAVRNSVDLSLFSKVHFSSEKHQIKSDDAFFLNLVKSLGLKPEECFYTDDSLKHIEHAKLLGFQAHLFKNNEEFLLQIKSL